MCSKSRTSTDPDEKSCCRERRNEATHCAQDPIVFGGRPKFWRPSQGEEECFSYFGPGDSLEQQALLGLSRQAC